MTCQLPCESVPDLVRGFLIAADLCEHDHEAVAEFLGVSWETVRRRLAKSGTSWRELKHQEQERRLRSILEKGGRIDFLAAANRCGFTRTDRFSDFFQQVMGQTFTEWRKERAEIAE